ncbi:hypothetical protein NP233_g3629 [Leucocoprinus birnbaumii]|uniref:F-box domain-containing protein n=1 Tax=Leucocoprinus birnbaumii TaxID=56174 RepID=A0AAD5VYT4_9AGAR|nr:hypothetical protein NP233_g3629 [Leucocoprinus birnbaumii]
MVALDKLPCEVLMHIVQYLSNERKSLKELRLTSKALTDPATSILFYSLAQTISTQDLEKCSAMTEDLKAGRTSVFHYTKNFILVTILMVPQTMKNILEPWFELWQVLIPAMPNLQTLKWIYGPSTDHPIAWVNNLVKVLGVQRNLKHTYLSIINLPPVEFSLGPLSALRSINVRWGIDGKPIHDSEPNIEERSFISQLSALLGRCPDLESLRFSVSCHRDKERWGVPSSTLKLLLGGWSALSRPLRIREAVFENVTVDPEDISLHLRHLHYLEELIIHPAELSTPTLFGEVYSLLQEAEIHLKIMDVDSLQKPGVIQYVASYRGLERLTIDSNDPLDDSPQIVERFVSSFHMHCQSLKSLRMKIRRISPWPSAIVEHLYSHAEEYMTLRELHLRLCFTQDDLDFMKGVSQPLNDLLEAATLLPELQRLECSFAICKTGEPAIDNPMTGPVMGPSNVIVFMKSCIEYFKNVHDPIFEIELLGINMNSTFTQCTTGTSQVIPPFSRPHCMFLTDMLRLDDLPDDVLAEIIERLQDDPQSLRETRLTSKHFNRLVVPVLFSTIEHVPSESYRGQLKCLDMISDLRAGKKYIFSVTRQLVLRLDTELLYSSFQESLGPWFELWDIMLPTMKSLRSLHWTYRPSDTYSTGWVNGFLRTLGAQNTLVDLTLVLQGAPPSLELSLQPISNLQTISIHWEIFEGSSPGSIFQQRKAAFISQLAGLLGRCPGLRSLTFVASRFLYPVTDSVPRITFGALMHGVRPPTQPLRLRRLNVEGAIVDPEDIRFHLGHLQNLEQLSIAFDPSPSASTQFGEICSILQVGDIHLKSMSVATPGHPGVSSYISSYCGLEKLVLNSLYSSDDSPAFIEPFISAFHGHCQTMKVLEVNINRLSPWPKAIVVHLRTRAIDYTALQRLRLRLCITQDDVSDNKDDNLQELLEVAMQLQALRRLECSFVAYKTGNYTFDWTDFKDLVEPLCGSKRPSQIHMFMERVIAGLKQTYRPTFNIVVL